MRRLSLLLLALWVVALPAGAGSSEVFARLDGRTVRYPEIDATVSRLMRAAQIPGVALALLNGGRTVYLKTYGVRSEAPDEPLTPDSVMSAASFTKVAFSYLVLELVDDHTLELDKPLHEYLPRPLPDYPGYHDLADDARHKLVTARMVLSHTAGFANWRSLEDDRRLRIHFQPGSRYAYSGEGFVLLQRVVESVTGMPLQELMQQRIFGPLRMTRTGMVWQSAFETDYSSSFDESGRPLGPQRRSAADAAGSMQTTITDFSRFMQAVLAGRGLASTTSTQMLSPQIAIVSKHEFPTLAAATTTANRSIQLAYGLGWGLYQTPHGKAFFKEGHDAGWRNYVVCYQRVGTCMVIMTNGAHGEEIYAALLRDVLGDRWNPIEWEGFAPQAGGAEPISPTTR